MSDFCKLNKIASKVVTTELLQIVNSSIRFESICQQKLGRLPTRPHVTRVFQVKSVHLFLFFSTVLLFCSG